MLPEIRIHNNSENILRRFLFHQIGLISGGIIMWVMAKYEEDLIHAFQSWFLIGSYLSRLIWLVKNVLYFTRLVPHWYLIHSTSYIVMYSFCTALVPIQNQGTPDQTSPDVDPDRTLVHGALISRCPYSEVHQHEISRHHKYWSNIMLLIDNLMVAYRHQISRLLIGRSGLDQSESRKFQSLFFLYKYWNCQTDYIIIFNKCFLFRRLRVKSRQIA